MPGDPSAAAFFAVAGAVVPGSAVDISDVYSGPARLGFVTVLQRMGADVTLIPGDGDPEAAPHRRFAIRVNATTRPLTSTQVASAEIPSLDEIPALAVAAAVAEGTTVFFDVGELRVKEVDRLAAVIDLVEAFGATARAEGDTLAITGVGGPLRGARFDSRGDHRMAMAAAVAALAAAPGERSLITGFDAAATSYPGFADDLGRLTSAAGPAERPPRPPRPLLVAIDGPAGAGKSTVSSAVASQLGLERLDTGAMYRAVAALALERGVAPDDAAAVATLASAADIEVGAHVTIDGLDVTSVIRSPEVGTAVSVVAANPEVRAELVRRQRAWAVAHGGGVVEGRDIGSVVFPDAELKVYLTASPEERARRRHDEAPEGVARRDRIDSTRDASPLRQATTARHLDTTGRTVQDVVEEVLSWLASTSGPAPGAEDESGAPAAPGRHQPFEVEPRYTPLYRVERSIFVTALWAWFRPQVTGKEHVPATGPVILAPVHRSFADFAFAAFCTHRKLFFMTKDEMWKHKALGNLLLSVGAFPVHRRGRPSNT